MSFSETLSAVSKALPAARLPGDQIRTQLRPAALAAYTPWSAALTSWGPRSNVSPV